MSLSLYSEYRQQQLEALLEITRIFASSPDLSTLLRTILGYAAELVRADFGYIALTTRAGALRITTGYRLPTAVFERLSPYLAQKRPVAEFWSEEELRYQLTLVNEVVDSPLEQIIALPLVLEDEQVVGGIFLFRAGTLAFTPGDRMLLRDFADQAAVAVRNARQVEQLRTEKARVEAIIENNPNGIMILDPNMRVEIINRALSKLLGVASEEVRGKHCADVLKLANPTGEHLCLARGAPPPPTRQVIYGEGDIIRPGRKRVTVGVSYAPLFGGDGELVNIIVTFVDITRYREAEELKSTFISVISHELKTPVSIIKGYAGTLAREDVELDPEFVRESGRIIVEEADRLTELIDNLLDASRIQAGALSLRLEPVDLVEIARKSVARFRSQSPTHHFVLAFPDKLPLVKADDRRLRQVFDNLISNAVKYSPEGGTIVVGAREEDGRVRVFVRDEGVGIPEEELDAIFEPFYRVDSSLRRKAQGAGLGLFLVRAIVRAMGGDIWVESEPGNGSTFYFTLSIA
ncbi:MAG TPA: sensor histidine kinase [Anaerolineae bacterium]|nr:sensor histidine kinase [Anaerolineae bacterium]